MQIRIRIVRTYNRYFAEWVISGLDYPYQGFNLPKELINAKSARCWSHWI